MLSVPSIPVSSDVQAEQNIFVESVAERLQGFLFGQRDILQQVSPDSLPMVDSIGDLVLGGKRLRALMCYWGWRGAGGAAKAPEIIAAGTALEFFQAAALIHDDIIDRSDMRRGAPSVHRRFSNEHIASGWSLDPDRFGEAAAILTGNLCLSYSDEVLSSAGPNAAFGTPARNVFNRMRTEVMAGQYLDVLEEVAGPHKDPASVVARAQAILRYKSAKYSSEHPLVIGGALAGAPKRILNTYSEFALPLGEAFQIRDDVLGVFGEPDTTGKPAGDDLREGKRTVLVGFALNAAPPAEAAVLEAQLGNQNLDPENIETLRGIIVSSGALASTEALITQLGATALDALSAMEIEAPAMTALTALAEAAIRRTI